MFGINAYRFVGSLANAAKVCQKAEHTFADMPCGEKELYQIRNKTVTFSTRYTLSELLFSRIGFFIVFFTLCFFHCIRIPLKNLMI